MARRLRVQYPGTVYPSMSHGDRGETIFLDDQDRERFLETLGEACSKTGWRVHAYGLMLNHFHLVVETQEPNLVVGMKWLLSEIARRLRKETTMTLKWIAEALHMGIWTHVSNRLHHARSCPY